MLNSRHRLLRSLLLAGSLVLLTSLLGGCGIFSPEETKETPITPPPEPYPLATTPDQLVENFVNAHNDRNFQEYDLILHDNFEFHFAAEDVDASGTDGIWDRQRDVASTEAMFTGEPGKVDDEGNQQSPVQSIVLNLAPEGVWTDSGIPAEFEADLKRNYSVIMTVSYSNGDNAAVKGDQEFYVKKITLDGGVQVYQIRVWRDTGNPL